jgi:glycosyltransferase involved in cell wall biosynthesis
MNNNRIIHIIDSLARGGAEILLKNSVNNLPEWEHTIVHLYPISELANEFKGDVSFICVHHKGWKSLLSTASKLKKIINKQRPLLVHSHLLKSTLCARLGTPRKIPLVTTIHSTYSIDAFEKKRVSVWMEKLTIRNRHAIIGVSRYVLEDYLGFIPFKGKSFVLYNFLHDSSFYQGTGSLGRNLKCVAIGNLKEAKNYAYLLDIFSNLKGSGISIDIYGEGGLRKQLQKRIELETLPVKLCGKAAAIDTVLPDYDLFIQASTHEGFGISVIEAMAASLPVFVSDLPVFREITGTHAHFFSLSDAGAAAEILKKFKDNASLRNEHVQQAYYYCRQHYNQIEYRKRLLDIYNEVTFNSLLNTAGNEKKVEG